MKKRKNWKVLILTLLVVYLVAFIGSIFTSSNTNTEWYNSIKPSITPPNWVFPIVWNVLFFLIALSLYFSWIGSKKENRTKIALVFGINLVLNVLWSFLFFSLKNPLLSFFEIILLELSILSMILITFKINKISSYLLWPYLLWVFFAGILNFLMAF
ncbi:MAG: tryptophan-rich sensory protein [Nanoarchaeota archaeon]|nr:tryptophan-rich sensory protein [Nanoarchaeota archaeon]MBU1028100.1 tryptophan-rich sensory protein [Nanoarchaeota archaeon]